MKKNANTKYYYMCEYPDAATMLPESTVTIKEYSETGLLEAYVLANSQLDKANVKLMTLGEFVANAKRIQEEANAKQ